MRFDDRRDAGRRLADRLTERLSALPPPADRPLVLALPRGGVPVALEVARVLEAPLDVLVVRKLGVPVQPELAMGAVSEGGARVLNDRVIDQLRLDAATIAEVEAIERREIDRRVAQYRGDRPAEPVEGRTVVLVDDGLATGSTAEAAVELLRARGVARIVLAVPVAPRETADRLERHVHDLVCLHAPANFVAVGQWYRDFTQVSDAEVEALLAEAGTRPDAGGAVGWAQAGP